MRLRHCEKDCVMTLLPDVAKKRLANVVNCIVLAVFSASLACVATFVAISKYTAFFFGRPYAIGLTVILALLSTAVALQALRYAVALGLCHCCIVQSRYYYDGIIED